MEGLTDEWLYTVKHFGMKLLAAFTVCLGWVDGWINVWNYSKSPVSIVPGPPASEPAVKCGPSAPSCVLVFSQRKKSVHSLYSHCVEDEMRFQVFFSGRCYWSSCRGNYKATGLEAKKLHESAVNKIYVSRYGFLNLDVPEMGGGVNTICWDEGVYRMCMSQKRWCSIR